MDGREAEWWCWMDAGAGWKSPPVCNRLTGQDSVCGLLHPLTDKNANNRLFCSCCCCLPGHRPCGGRRRIAISWNRSMHLLLFFICTSGWGGVGEELLPYFPFYFFFFCYFCIYNNNGD